MLLEHARDVIQRELRQAPRDECYLWRRSGLTATDCTELLEEWLEQGIIERQPGGMVRLVGHKYEEEETAS